MTIVDGHGGKNMPMHVQDPLTKTHDVHMYREREKRGRRDFRERDTYI